MKFFYSFIVLISPPTSALYLAAEKRRMVLHA